MATATTKVTVSDDAEDYVLKTKQRASKTGRVEEKLAAVEDAEVSRISKEIDKVRMKKTLDELRKGLNEQGSSNPILASMFAGKTPTEINDILMKMTPEAVDKLQLIITKLDPTSNLIATATAQPQQPRVETGNEMLLKYLLEKADKQQGNGLTLEGVAALITALKPAQTAIPQQQGMNQADMLKLILEFNRPLYDQLKVKDKDLMEAKLNEIKANMPPDFMEQVKYIKEMAPVLGFGGAGVSELDLKLEAMKQDRDVDLKRLDWEQKKYEMEQEGDIAKWESIGKILQGPIGQAIQGIGNAGADRVRGGGGGRKVGRQPTAVQTQCPNCQHVIYVDAEADTAICGQCGATLQKQGTPTPQQAPQEQPQPPPTRVEEKQAPEPAQEQEEEEENGPDETPEGTETG